MEINIIYEDKNLVVAEKPAGMPSQPDKTGDTDILTLLEKKYNKVWLVHRLDRPVGGLMVFALNEKTASYLGKQVLDGKLGKEYMAVCCGVPKNESGELRNWLVKNQRLNISEVVNGKINKNAKEAVLDYRLIKTVDTEKFGKLSLVYINLHTGRHHQIRVQFANAGTPLWGDTKYNPKFKRGFYGVNTALYAYRLTVVKPGEKTELILEKAPNSTPFDLF